MFTHQEERYAQTFSVNRPVVQADAARRFASFEPADIASLKRMYDIVKAAGGATKDPPASAFDTGPYMRAKKIK